MLHNAEDISCYESDICIKWETWEMLGDWPLEECGYKISVLSEKPSEY